MQDFDDEKSHIDGNTLLLDQPTSRWSPTLPRRRSRRIILVAGILCAFFILRQTFPVLYFWHWGPLTDAPRASDSNCDPFDLSQPHLTGVTGISITAADVTNYTFPSNWLPPLLNRSVFAPSFEPISFCNITVTYTHPGFNDSVKVSLWLPRPDAWNSRFQGTGGGGFSVGGGDDILFAPVSRGFAAANTDGGVPSGQPTDWALTSPGNVDLNTLHTYASTALADMTKIGQQITASYYGRSPKFSYWNGCSTGGRQGLQLAQSHPDLYDGILALAPAINFPSLVTAMFWPQIFMETQRVYPQPCELAALTAAAINACDDLDDVIDGIISLPDRCKAHFDPFSLIGRVIPCPAENKGNATTTISTAAIKVASAAWAGAKSEAGYKLWPGLNHEAELASTAGTTCIGSECGPSPNNLAAQWIQLFLLKRPFPGPSETFEDVLNLSLEDYTDLFHAAAQQYNSIIGTNDPDLSVFAKRGGKMITWHGQADQIVMPNGSVQYYQSVLEHFEHHLKAYQPWSLTGDHAKRNDSKLIEHVSDFYRLYLAPGVAHCMGGPGPFPGGAWESAGALDELIDWVERGNEPDTLYAVSDPNTEGKRWRRPLCLWPKVAVYKGAKGGEREAAGWTCENIES